MKASRLRRTVVLVCTGGVLVQVGGCGAILGPTLLSIGEQLLLSLLFGGLLGG
ncbi:MAG: hypothetical protein ACYSUQ_05390 [Planctomycetota bacterium]